MTPITAPAVFLFTTEDCTILGWNPNVNPVGDAKSRSTHAIIAVDHSSSGAVYKGLAISADSRRLTSSRLVRDWL
jgi:hypothetical protein